LFSGQDHDQPVEAKRDTAMWGRTAFERLQEKAEDTSFS
jgi:hypothetical protein